MIFNILQISFLLNCFYWLFIINSLRNSCFKFNYLIICFISYKRCLNANINFCFLIKLFFIQIFQYIIFLFFTLFIIKYYLLNHLFFLFFQNKLFFICLKFFNRLFFLFITFGLQSYFFIFNKNLINILRKSFF